MEIWDAVKWRDLKIHLLFCSEGFKDELMEVKPGHKDPVVTSDHLALHVLPTPLPTHPHQQQHERQHWPVGGAPHS